MTLTAPMAASAKVGDAISPLTVQPTVLQLFRYSAVTWNGHKIHYDPQYAAQEGHPGLLVHSHLHAAFLTRACTQWAGPLTLRSMSYRIIRPATPADRLTVTGTVTARAVEGDEVRLVIELVEANADGQPCAVGTATVGVPPGASGGSR